MSRYELPDQPDGIEEDSRDVPDPARAAERVLAYVAEWGDGLYDVAGGHPLYGRDLESLARAALATAQPVKVCHACGMGYSCAEHDPRPAGAPKPPPADQSFIQMESL